MVEKEKSSGGLSKLNTNYAASPKESDNSVGISSESTAPSDEDGVQKIIDTESPEEYKCE